MRNDCLPFTSLIMGLNPAPDRLKFKFKFKLETYTSSLYLQHRVKWDTLFVRVGCFSESHTVRIYYTKAIGLGENRSS